MNSERRNHPQRTSKCCNSETTHFHHSRAVNGPPGSLRPTDVCSFSCSRRRTARRQHRAAACRAGLQNGTSWPRSPAAEMHWSREVVAGRAAEGSGGTKEPVSALRRLANVATGTDPRNPGFHRFVLAERLDEVLLAANRRLGPMSDERYRLQRVRDEENRRVGRSPDPT